MGKRIFVAWLLVASSVLGGCGAIGVVGSPRQQYSLKDTVQCKGPVSEYSNKVVAAGQPSGFVVSGRGPTSIQLRRDSHSVMIALIGKVDTFQISASWATPGQIALDTIVVGNFGAATEEAVSKEMQPFKQRLQSAC